MSCCISASAFSSLPSMVLKEASSCWNSPRTLTMLLTSSFTANAPAIFDTVPRTDSACLSRRAISTDALPVFTFSSSTLRPALSRPPDRRSRISISISTGFVAILFLQVALEKSYNVFRLVLRALLFFLFAYITRRVGKHHDEGLVVHAFQDVVYAPSCGIRYLPDKAEGAMGRLVDRL